MSQESLLVIFGGAVVTTLAGAVTFLFTIFHKSHEELKKRLDKCESDREQLWREIASIEVRLREIK